MSETTDQAGAVNPAPAITYDIRQILNALPHRYPLLLVDRVKSLEIGERIHAVKAVSFNEQFFQGHFPGRPIMPGVLQIEALAFQVRGPARRGSEPAQFHEPDLMLRLLLASRSMSFHRSPTRTMFLGCVPQNELRRVMQGKGWL